MYLYGIEIAKAAVNAYFRAVLIVPLWNWNSGNVGSGAAATGSNCTFMELKLYDARLKAFSLYSSNCTFMELKF